MPIRVSDQFRVSFSGELWKHDGPSGWCFITIPKSASLEIRKRRASSEEGWGRLKAEIKIGKSKWKTAIWFDTKHDAYLLPVKAEIRKKEKLAIGEKIAAEANFEATSFF